MFRVEIGKLKIKNTWYNDLDFVFMGLNLKEI